ncbi:hypothetical protein BGZ95_011815 [Linnemannia exigua]|uniref:receptor protein-tyrosine kinase n=1 Tax=Linnemannia exigua TaxID=604196 RepID=A0AAD4D9D3_9FUNG|nr:hypothetical protein BGZ95_011815 [Linnemannia exigua]
MTPSHKHHSTRRMKSSTVLITTIAFLLSPSPYTLHTIINVNAQITADPGPVPVTGAASARATTRFYIIGGLNSTTNGTLPLDQFFSLSLTTSWSTTAPAWTKLSSIGAPKQRIFPATFSKNQKSLIVFRAGEPDYIRRYIVASGNWSPSSVTLTYGSREGVGAVTDPNTGLVYVARGYTDAAERSVDVYNVDRDTLSEVPLPLATEALAQRTYYGNVWCQPRKSILYFGGYALETQPAPTSPVITEFSPSNQTWTTMTTTGEPPSLRADHCMTISEDGTRMVVYGGSPTDKTIPMSGEVFMFNTLTRTWTKGLSGPPRAYATCTIAGDQLLIWGGTTLDKTVAPAEVLIYNMASATWIKSYTPPAWYLDPSATATSAGSVPGTPNPDSEGSSSSNKVGPIVGGIVGGLVLVLAVVFFLFWRRRQQRRKQEQHQTEKSVASYDHDNTNNINTHDIDNNIINNNNSPDNSSALEKLHAGLSVGGGLSADKTRQEEKSEIVRLREELLAQKEQQADLQKQVELLKNQHMPGGAGGGGLSMESTTLDSSIYGYQPPIYYSPGTSCATTILFLCSTASIIMYSNTTRAYITDSETSASSIPSQRQGPSSPPKPNVATVGAAKSTSITPAPPPNKATEQSLKTSFTKSDIEYILTFLEHPSNFESVFGSGGQIAIGGPKSSNQGYALLAQVVSRRSRGRLDLNAKKMREQFACHRKTFATTKKRSQQAGFGVTDEDRQKGIYTIVHKLEITEVIGTKRPELEKNKLEWEKTQMSRELQRLELEEQREEQRESRIFELEKYKMEQESQRWKSEMDARVTMQTMLLIQAGLEKGVPLKQIQALIKAVTPRSN